MKKRHLGAITAISAEEFTQDRHSVDNSTLDCSQPWRMPNVIGVAYMLVQ